MFDRNQLHTGRSEFHSECNSLESAWNLLWFDSSRFDAGCSDLRVRPRPLYTASRPLLLDLTKFAAAGTRPNSEYRWSASRRPCRASGGQRKARCERCQRQAASSVPVCNAATVADVRCIDSNFRYRRERDLRGSAGPNDRCALRRPAELRPEAAIGRSASRRCLVPRAVAPAAMNAAASTPAFAQLEHRKPLWLENVDPVAHGWLEGNVLLGSDPPRARLARLELHQGMLVVARQKGHLRRGLTSVRTGQRHRYG